MAVKMIIGTDQMFGIGKDNKLPWDCHEDLQYFKKQTLNSTVIMGRTTYESLPFENGLPRRKNYVLTRTKKFMTTFGDSLELPSLPCVENSRQSYFCSEEFLHNLMTLSKEDIWVIGGASIYKQLLPYVEEIHHTIIDGVYDCDTFFNMDFLEYWELVGGKDLSDKAVVNIYRKLK
mgnify:CR=1 FL=1